MQIKKFWKLYPKSTNRNVISSNRNKVKTKIKKKLMKFGKEYFDGKRIHGYGGYYYNKKFFRKIVKEIIKYYKLSNGCKILDIGCAKGFMMYEFRQFLPNAEIWGLDISKYCKMKALSSEKKFIKVGSCHKLPFKDNYFDFIISISTIHNLAEKKISLSIKEIERVKKGKSFIRVKGYKNLKEKKFIDDWNLVAKSNLSIKKWNQIFKKSKYTGDFDFSNF
jgi:ubiquinone/menaquinone biosynthesis C-methylase UbiE